MGIGGLLRETRARGDTGDAGRPPRLAGIVLAAGQSARMGAANKLLADLRGQPLVRHVVESLLNGGLDPVMVVTGHDAERVRSSLADLPVRFVHNAAHSDGMSTSVAAGIESLPPATDGALIALGDMAEIDARHVTTLVDAFVEGEGRSICAPVSGHRRGNPVVWPARYYPELMMLEGDVGARHLLRVHDEAVREVPFDDDAVVHDVDTPEDLARLRARRS